MQSCDATLRASRWKQGGNGAADFGYFNAGTPIDPNSNGVITFAEVISTTLNPINTRVGGGNLPSDPDPYVIARDTDFNLDTEQETLDLEVNYDLGFANAKVLLSFADFSANRTADADLSFLPSGFDFQEDSARTFSEELQLTSQTDGPLQWTLGAFLLQDDTRGLFAFDRIFATDPLTNTPILTTPAAPGSDFNSLALIDTRSIAFYGQATYSLTEAFRLTGGLRWTQDKKDFSRVTNSNFTVPLIFTATPFVDSATFDKLTWKAGAEFDITPDHLIYASASTGFQAGGFNNSADSVTGGASFNEQTIRAFELGSKNAYLDGALTANLALFYNEFDGLLANEFVTVGTTVLTISTNAGAATAYGAEADVTWAPADNIRFNALASYNNAEFGTYVISEPVSNTQNDLDGQRVPLSPKFTFGLGAEYDFALGNGGNLTPAGNLYYSANYSTNDVDYAFAQQDGYAKLDLRLTYRAPSGNWYVEAFGRNITDEAVLNRTVRFGQNAIAQNFSDPRTYGVRFGFRN